MFEPSTILDRKVHRRRIESYNFSPYYVNIHGGLNI